MNKVLSSPWGVLMTVMMAGLLVQDIQAQPLTARVKDIAVLEGIQDNPLIGYGLVGGLEGTGDGRRGFTAQTLNNLIAGLGINVLQQNSITTEVIPDNVAAVMVVATLPPFARPGTRINCSVVSLGRADSLQGGYLIPTPLKGADGKFHGVAYGPVSLGGFVVSAGGGGGGASVQENHTVVATIPNGVIVEGETVFQDFFQGDSLLWLLHNPDFKTAANLEREINAVCQDHVAVAEDASAVQVNFERIQVGGLPKIRLGKRVFDSLVNAIAFIDETEIEVDEPAKIIINERTGTVVAGQNIRVRDAVIAHGPLRITIQTTPEVSQPGFGSGGQTVQTAQTQVTADVGDKVALVQGTTIGEVIANLNQLGYTPRDLIAILQSMAAAGYIKAEVEMIQ
ncbi:MAG: flagellar basal body P-ring protein FlgI [Candidatus Omnitrophica bacterium]|nr:flagellar basal body P-ring protein FlgI [Candidatus Omnitrophota bacterium]